jgi:hypothetical protein
MFSFRAIYANFAAWLASPAALAVPGVGNLGGWKIELFAGHSSDLGASLGRRAGNTRLVPNGIPYSDYFWTDDRYFVPPSNEIVTKDCSGGWKASKNRELISIAEPFLLMVFLILG